MSATLFATESDGLLREIHRIGLHLFETEKTRDAEGIKAKAGMLLEHEAIERALRWGYSPDAIEDTLAKYPPEPMRRRG